MVYAFFLCLPVNYFARFYFVTLHCNINTQRNYADRTCFVWNALLLLVA